MSQVIIGYTTEGTTDLRFLESIIQRTFEWVAFECKGDVEVLPLIPIAKEPGSFVEQMTLRCIAAYDMGIMIFCIHVDADSDDDQLVSESRMEPLLMAINNHFNKEICINVVPVIPVHMTEAWMLADIELLKTEIGTDIRNETLGLHRTPERITDPKQTIENAIRIAREEMVSRKRKQLSISELYQPIGQKIKLDKLLTLSSYARFYESVKHAYAKMNFL